MNFQVVPYSRRDFVTDVEIEMRSKSNAAETNVVPLSEIIVFGNDFLLMKRQNAMRNDSSVKFGTTSRCTALVLAQVKKHM